MAVNRVPVVGNRIVVATGEPDNLAKERVVGRADALARRGRFPFDLGEILEKGYERLTEPVSRGEVLEDR